MKRLIIFEDSVQRQVVEKLLETLRHSITFDSLNMENAIDSQGWDLLEDITIIQTHESKTIMRDCKGFETKSDETIDELLSHFNSPLFLKISPTMAINLTHIEEVGFSPASFLKLSGGTQINLSEEVAKLFIRHLNHISK